MILFLTAVDLQRQWRDFSCRLDALESALDVLGALAGQGDTLVSARIVDEDGCLELPVEAFDARLFSGPMQQLQREWEHILAEPRRATPSHAEPRPARLRPESFADLKQRRIQLHEQKIGDLRHTIAQMESLRETTLTMSDGAAKDGLLLLQQQTILRCRQSIARSEAYQAALLST